MTGQNGVWYKSKMLSYPGRGTVTNCICQLADDILRVRYKEERTTITYSGREVSEGHFRLVADVVKGKATLHRFSHDCAFEGSWEQEGQTGLWRITVSDQEV